MLIAWSSGLEDQGWSTLGASPVWEGLALLEIEIVAPPLGIVVTAEQGRTCTVVESARTCTVIEEPDMDCYNEESSGVYDAYLYDPLGDPVTLAQLTALDLTLHDPETGDIVNAREAQDVLNANDVTVADVTRNGATVARVRWSIQPEDTVILNDTKLKENRIALWHYAWNGGEHHHEYAFQVKNLQLVPAAS